jgi:hypothetical protein
MTVSPAISTAAASAAAASAPNSRTRAASAIYFSTMVTPTGVMSTWRHYPHGE